MIAMNKADSKSITYHPQKNYHFFFKFTLLDVDECSKKVHSCDVNAPDIEELKWPQKRSYPVHLLPFQS